MNKLNEILELLRAEFSNDFDGIAFKKISAELVTITENNKDKIGVCTSALQEKIKHNVGIISGLDADIKTMNDYIEENQALENKCVELENKHAELLIQKEQIEKLQTKRQYLRDNQSFIDSFANNLQQINNNIDSTIADFLIKLTGVQDLLSDSDLENKLKDIIHSVQGNLEKVKQDDILQCLEYLSSLKTKFTNIDNEINTKIEEHNNLAKQINDVNDAFNSASEKLKTMQEAHRKHVSSDRDIVNSFAEKGEFKMESWIKTSFEDLDRLLEEIENKIRIKIDERKKMPICKILERQGNTIVEK